MFKNLNPSYLGISGRQSEVIELALTYGYKGLDQDLRELAKRVQSQGEQLALGLLSSANLRIGGVELPARWRSDESIFAEDMKNLEELAEMAARAKVYCCVTHVLPESDELPYHENFERHRARLGQIAELLGKHGIRLAVGFHAAESRREGRRFQFMREADALIMLVKSAGNDNMGLWLDTWNWYVGGGTVEALKSFGPERIAYVTVADAPADTDRAHLKEQQRLLPIDDGAASLADVFELLKSSGYRGPVSLAPDQDVFTGMSRDAIAQKCSQVLTDLFKAAEGEKALTSTANSNAT